MVAAAVHAPAPAYVGVEEDDRATPWRLDASRASVRVLPGAARRRVAFSIRNYGMDPHDLAVRKVGTSQAIAVSALVGPAVGGRPGTGSLRVSLPPGRYILFCSVAAGTPLAHSRQGMVERFRVLPRA